MDEQLYLPFQNTSGLDMAPTIKWYNANAAEFTSRLDGLLKNTRRMLPYNIRDAGKIPINIAEINALINLFPDTAIQRSVLETIIGQPETWFHKVSVDEQPRATTNSNDALSRTAIIPSYTDPSKWTRDKPSVDIWLYGLSDKACSPQVRRLILAEGFLHEFGGHSLVMPATYVDGYKLKLPGGKIVDGRDYLIEFGQLAEQRKPISHYSSAYRNPDNTFKIDPKSPNVQLTSVSEELCESIAAHILGFSFTGNDETGKNPFTHRPEIKKFVQDFLNASLFNEL